MNHEVGQHGFAVMPRVIDAYEQRELLSTLGPVSGAGRRGLLALPAVAGLARSPRLLKLIRPHRPLRSCTNRRGHGRGRNGKMHGPIPPSGHGGRSLMGHGDSSGLGGEDHAQNRSQ